jgi:putative ABC transport system permease protein
MASHLVRHVLIESLLLSGFGAALGLLLLYDALCAVRALKIDGILRLVDAGLNLPVLGCSVLIAVVSGMLAGLAPALQAPYGDIAAALREGDRQTGSRSQGRLRAVVVTGEVALSFLLLVGAGAASQRPVVGGNPGMGIGAPSCGESCAREVPWSNWRIVSPDYFRALGLPLVAGRGFDERDKSVWADSGQSNLDAEVVGVVGDMRDRGLASEPTRTVYLPYGMNALPGEVVIQTRGDPLALVPTVRSIVAALDPNLPMADVRSFDNVVDRSVAPERLNTLLPGVFGALALLLATAGICGVLSYSMSRRTSEIGLRVALGATGGRVLRMAVGQGMRPVVVGIALGMIGACRLSRYFTALLFGVKPFDLQTYVAVATLLLGTALAACYLPGRRAMRIDPATALRIA